MHLEKFNKCIEGDYKVKYYKINGFGKQRLESRLFITNQYLGRILVKKYGIIPHRKDCSLILQSIPEKFEKDFIRGVLDADGSFSYYIIHNTQNKYVVDFGTNEEITRYIEKILIKNNLINDTQRKLTKRHPEKDGNYITLKISGKRQCKNILDWLYTDSKIYLDRKYEKYLSIFGGDV